MTAFRHPAYDELRPVTRLATVLLARNPGPMTLDGTNTWLLRAPYQSAVVVVDPGPADERHLALIASAGTVSEILLTHGHPDHSAGARRLHEITGASVRAADPAHRFGGEGLGEGDVIDAAGVQMRVWATPGHTADSLSFVLTADDDQRVAVLTGDTILGRGTTVVAYPDGNLADYLHSLRRLRELGDAVVLPGHGPELSAVGIAAQSYLDHRQDRLAHVRAAVLALGKGATPQAVVERVYADVDRALWPAAELSVRAQLDYLAQDR